MQDALFFHIVNIVTKHKSTSSSIQLIMAFSPIPCMDMMREMPFRINTSHNNAIVGHTRYQMLTAEIRMHRRYFVDVKHRRYFVM